MNGTPWNYIRQKKKTEEVSYEKQKVEQENQKLKAIVKKLLAKQELTDSEKQSLKELKLLL